MTNNTKEQIQYGSAVGMLLSGIVLTFICFFQKGDVTDNILIYVGQALVYCGSIFGISIYAKSKISEELNKLKNKMTRDETASK